MCDNDLFLNRFWDCFISNQGLKMIRVSIDWGIFAIVVSVSKRLIFYKDF